ncbi:serine aminopeptidase domain-containing protein [Hyphobacterium sp.]|uniref:alpha/beta hydrolase family protein n=1 Tax=Hyphobacterium sp. TaxID=2004662 RepID=UPI003748209D
MRPFALIIALLLAACGDTAPGPTGSSAESGTVLATAETDEARSDENGGRYEGDWSGTLDVGAAQLELVLEVRGDEAVLISVDQGGARMPIDITQMDTDGLTGTIASVGASMAFERIDSETLSGTFSQGGATVPLTLERDRVRGVFFPEDDAIADDFIVMSGDVRLAGTLQRPEGDGPFPAVLLLNGSGAQDRNATVVGQPVFGVLADALAERGIATLRLDDRGIGGSDAVAPASPHDLADDAVAAMAAMRGAGGVDASCAAILGHSEGGLIAFLAANEAEPAFLITLAGMHMTMADTLYDQSEAIFLASGAGQGAADRNRALQDAMFAVMRDETVTDYPAALTEALTALGFPEEAARQQGAIWGQDYAVAALDLDPAFSMAEYDGPVHAFFGERDLQVRHEPQSAALSWARRDHPTEITVVPGVNHLFQQAETGLPEEYATAPHAMSPEALDLIGEAAESLITQTCTAE